jgi:hypothetical protein
MSSLETLIKETKAAFIIAVGDGVLDASEVIQIAVDLSRKIQTIAGLSGSKKKETLLFIIKKALDASNGINSLPGLASASQETKQAFEDQLLNAVSGAIEVFISASQGKLTLKKAWSACVPSCLAMVAVMSPKDSAILEEVSKFATKVVESTETTVRIVDETKIE